MTLNWFIPHNDFWNGLFSFGPPDMPDQRFPSSTKHPPNRSPKLPHFMCIGGKNRSNDNTPNKAISNKYLFLKWFTEDYRGQVPWANEYLFNTKTRFIRKCLPARSPYTAVSSTTCFQWHSMGRSSGAAVLDFKILEAQN